MVYLCGLLSSICYDFWVKVTGKPRLFGDMVGLLPIPDSPSLYTQIVSRTLRLNCLGEYYQELWNVLFGRDFNRDIWTRQDHRLRKWTGLTSTWQWEVPFRTQFERRQAMIELDVLGALVLGLTLDELLTIYRIQFPVLQKYENKMRFDQLGIQVPVKTVRGELMPNEDHPDFPNMVPPFTPVNREADYRKAWPQFEKRLVEEK